MVLYVILISFSKYVYYFLNFELRSILIVLVINEIKDEDSFKNSIKIIW